MALKRNNFHRGWLPRRRKNQLAFTFFKRSYSKRHCRRLKFYAKLFHFSLILTIDSEQWFMPNQLVSDSVFVKLNQKNYNYWDGNTMQCNGFQLSDTNNPKNGTVSTTVGEGGDGGGSSSSLKRSWRVIGWPQSSRPVAPCRGLEGGRGSGLTPP